MMNSNVIVGYLSLNLYNNYLMITISRLTISGCIGLAIIVFTSLGSNVLAQKLRNWEMRGKVESHVPIYNPAYGENSYIGLGAEAERYFRSTSLLFKREGRILH
jgi:hypothetical protein